MTQKIELKAGAEARVGNTTYRIAAVYDRAVGIDIIQFGSISGTAAVKRSSGQDTMPIATMRRRVGDFLAYTDGM